MLLWDNRHKEKGKNGKFDALWMCPYSIDIRIGDHALFLKDIYGELLDFLVNVKHLKHFLE